MTTYDDARKWFHRANACFQSFQEAEQRIAECEIKLEQAEISGSKRLAERWSGELDFARAQLDAIERQLYATIKTTNRDEVVNRLVDVAVRFEECNQRHEDWRRTLAVQQAIAYNMTLTPAEEVDEEDSDAAAEAGRLAELSHEYYTRAVQLLVAAVPV